MSAGAVVAAICATQTTMRIIREGGGPHGGGSGKWPKRTLLSILAVLIAAFVTSLVLGLSIPCDGWLVGAFVLGCAVFVAGLVTFVWWTVES